jgi:hypothetical protein
MTLRELAEAIAKREGWKTKGGKGAISISVPVAAGRQQSVELVEFDHDDAPMVRFISRVGDAAKLDPARCRTALELNAKFPTGSLAISDGALVMTDTRPLKTTTPESSANAVRFLASQADTYERFIYKTDAH